MKSTAARRLSLVEHRPGGSPSGLEPVDAADAAIDAWRGIEAALVPVIGKQGFSALYLRCLAVRSRQEPWLPKAHPGESDWDGFAPLRLALRGRESAEAALAQRELLREFRELLVSLLGASLVTRLLPPLEPA